MELKGLRRGGEAERLLELSVTLVGAWIRMKVARATVPEREGRQVDAFLR